MLSSYLPVKETLHDFLQHLNGIHGSIKFTMELEQNGTLSLLDVLVKKKIRMVHWATRHIRKPNTWTWIYMWIHTKSSSTKKAVLSTLIHCARTIWESLLGEIQHLQQTFKNNGYSSRDSQYALHARNKPQTTSEKPMGVALLPYQNFTSK